MFEAGDTGEVKGGRWTFRTAGLVLGTEHDLEKQMMQKEPVGSREA